MNPMTARIYRHLVARGSISAMEAQTIYRCRSLSRRICDLVQGGHLQVRKERRTDPTGQRYTRYHYVPPMVGAVSATNIVQPYFGG